MNKEIICDNITTEEFVAAADFFRLKVDIDVTSKLLDIIDYEAPEMQGFRAERLIGNGGYVVFNEKNKEYITKFLESVGMLNYFLQVIEIRNK
jgi:hypothetical protein